MQIALAGTPADDIVDELTAIDTIECVSREKADLLVTIGADALADCANRSEPRPILPAGVETPLSPSREQLVDVFERLPAEPSTVEVRPLSVTAGDASTTAVFDTALVTSEPARISEYTVSVGDRPHATFREDGVVVATPLGSSGYGRAAGGPQLEPATGVAVVPIAPFATHTDTWVLKPPLSVRVEREDSVTVFADTTHLAVGARPLTVEVTSAAPLSIVDSRGLSSP